jgi:hypothetical protein
MGVQLNKLGGEDECNSFYISYYGTVIGNCL